MPAERARTVSKRRRNRPVVATVVVATVVVATVVVATVVVATVVVAAQPRVVIGEIRSPASSPEHPARRHRR
jgi:hypothetical protein